MGKHTHTPRYVKIVNTSKHVCDTVSFMSLQGSGVPTEYGEIFMWVGVKEVGIVNRWCLGQIQRY